MNAFHEIIYHVLSLCGCECVCVSVSVDILFAVSLLLLLLLLAMPVSSRNFKLDDGGFFFLLDFIDCIRFSFILIKRRENVKKERNDFCARHFFLSCFVLFYVRTFCNAEYM